MQGRAGRAGNDYGGAGLGPVGVVVGRADNDVVNPVAVHIAGIGDLFAEPVNGAVAGEGPAERVGHAVETGSVIHRVDRHREGLAGGRAALAVADAETEAVARRLAAVVGVADQAVGHVLLGEAALGHAVDPQDAAGCRGREGEGDVRIQLLDVVEVQHGGGDHHVRTFVDRGARISALDRRVVDTGDAHINHAQYCSARPIVRGD